MEELGSAGSSGWCTLDRQQKRLVKSMRAKAKKRDATALASSGKGGKVYPPNECSVAEGDVKVDVPVQVLAHVVAYIIPIRPGEGRLLEG